MLKKVESNINLIIAVIFTLLAILPFLAPIFAHLGWNFLSDPIYWMYQWLCHQRSWRSYHLFDYQVADCARNNFIYTGLAISAFIIHFNKVKPLKTKYAFILAFVSILPLALDGTIQLIAEMQSAPSNSIPFYESTNFIRSVVGAILGTGVGFSVIPFLSNYGRGFSDARKILKYLIFVVVINILLIPVIVFFWNITSSKYKPSSLFIDDTQRFPGYNYEITGRAGHSTIKPVVNEPLDRYVSRAKKYNKQELIDEYLKKL